MLEPPTQLRFAATIQLVTGVVDVTIGWWFTTMLWLCGSSVVGGIGSAVCPCAPAVLFCSFAGFLVVPLGALEIIAGIVGLVAPQSAGTMLKISSSLGVLALFVGSVPSAVGGVVSWMQLMNPEVRGYLETA